VVLACKRYCLPTLTAVAPLTGERHDGSHGTARIAATPAYPLPKASRDCDSPGSGSSRATPFQ